GERALAITETVYGPEHPAVGARLNTLALILREIGDFAAARPLAEPPTGTFAEHASLQLVPQADRFRDGRIEGFLAVESGHLALAGPGKTGANVRSSSRQRSVPLESRHAFMVLGDA